MNKDKKVYKIYYNQLILNTKLNQKSLKNLQKMVILSCNILENDILVKKAIVALRKLDY